tara:strand:+ start:459 stop:653 length:195 start_codon:yes stop_codon:yes gene_type:complete
MDILGQILWYAIPLTPLLTIPIVWRLSKQKKIVRILMGLGLACILSFMFYHISLAICFRNGMGP